MTFARASHPRSLRCRGDEAYISLKASYISCPDLILSSGIRPVASSESVRGAPALVAAEACARLQLARLSQAWTLKHRSSA